MTTPPARVEGDSDPEGQGTTQALASFAAGLHYDDLPEPVRHQAKRIVLDTLACVIGAHPYETARITESVAAAVGGSAESHALPAGFLTSAPMAAFVNGELANVLDLDDNLLNHTHFANTSVTAPLAAAEAIGAGGPALIQAVVAAYEVSARIVLAQPDGVEVTGEWPDVEYTFRETTGMGFSAIGSAAGCGNVLALDAGQMRRAFGIAGYGAPVPSVTKATSAAALTMKKYASFGQIGWTANMAARLAAAGLTADEDVLDGPKGFWRMTGAPSFDWEIAVDGLGERWWSLETSFKLHPTCTRNRQPIAALEQIRAIHHFDVADIEAVDVLVHPAAAQRPPFRLQNPTNYLETQLSHPWSIAMTLLQVPPPYWQQPQTIADPTVQAVASKVRVGIEPAALRSYYEQANPSVAGVRRVRRWPSTVVLHLRNGLTLQATADYGAGDPYTAETAATDDELREKFVSFGELSVPRDRLERAADLVLELDGVEDLSGLLALMCVDPA